MYYNSKCAFCGDPINYPFNQCTGCVIYFHEMNKPKNSGLHFKKN